MFKITSNPTFAHDVDIQVPVDDGFSDQKLRVRYRVVDLDDLENLKLDDIKDQKKYLELIVDGFENLVDEDDKPIQNPHTLTKKILGRIYVRGPVMRAYMEAMAGAKVKN
jgi:small nuclear ribonucleoprotein (snRNP)-like protein